MCKAMSVCIAVLIVCLCAAQLLAAGRSSIVDATGQACMGDDKSRKQTEAAALAEAKKNAVEQVRTYMSSETRIKDAVVDKDLTEAYAKANVRLQGQPVFEWFRDPTLGECARLKIRAEVEPDESALSAASAASVADDPTAPLSVKLWTDKPGYAPGEKMRLYIKGNKPFYARILYKDAQGHLVQILPNPYRNAASFAGGVVHAIPAAEDHFDLEVTPPFGQENFIVYASTAPLGEIALQSGGAVYAVKDKAADVAVKSRGISIKEAAPGHPGVAEFFETQASVRTGK